MKLHIGGMMGAAAWGFAVGAVGFVADVTAVSSWAVVGCIALLPPLVMGRVWNNPGQTLSQRSQEAIR